MTTQNDKAQILPVYEFRPIVEGRKLLRYNNGLWTEDDGEYDISFVTDDNKDAPFHFYVSLPYYDNIQWNWVKDGKWGASVDGHPGYNAWHRQTYDGTKMMGQRWDRDSHPNIKVQDEASSFLCKKNGCANGRGVEFTIGDPTIIKGLLRERDTKKVVSFPEIFTCCYCGRHDLTGLNIEYQAPR